MLLNRKMEETLERLYKQSKVIGGVYFGLGQEAAPAPRPTRSARTTGSGR